jgi:hypothetical protein
MFAGGVMVILNLAAVTFALAICYYGWHRKGQMQGDFQILNQSLEDGLASLDGLDAPSDFFTAFGHLREKISSVPVLGPHWRNFERGLVKDPVNEVYASPISAADHFSYELLYSPELKLRKHEALPNQLVGIGLLGTFLGLTISLAIASAGLSGDVESAKRSLIALMSASAVKFVTSIAAISSALLFTHSKNEDLSKIHQLIDEFGACLDRLVVPISNEKIAWDSKAELSRQTEFLASRNEELASAIANALDERLKTSLKDAMAPVAKQIGEMGEKMGEISEATMRYMIEMFSKELGGAAKKHSERMAELLNEVSRAVERVPERIDASSAMFSSSLEAAAKEVERTFGQSGVVLSSILSDTSAAIEKNSSSWTDAGDRMELLLRAIARSESQFSDRLTAVNEMADLSVERLQNHVEALRLAVETMPALDHAARELQEASAMLERSVKEIAKLETIGDDAQRRSLEAGEQFLKTVNSIGSEMKALDVSLASVLANTASGLAGFKNQTEDITSSMDNQLAIAVGRLSDVVQDLKNTNANRGAIK